MSDSKKTAIEYFKEAYAEIPKDENSNESIVKLKIEKHDKNNPLALLRRGYERIAKQNKKASE